MYIKFNYQYFLLLILICQSWVIHAQSEQSEVSQSIQSVLESIISSNADLSEAEINDLSERLTELAASPLDLNGSDIQKLSELYLLNPLQIQDIVEHKRLFGNFLELFELQTLPSLSNSDIKRILPFLSKIGIAGMSPFKASMLYKGNKSIMMRYQLPLQKSKGYNGDPSVYLGSRERYSVRFRHQSPGRVSWGFGVEKDAGEPVDRMYNKLWFDFVTWHLSMDKVNKSINKIVIGDFQTAMGQGLIMFSGYGYGKSAFTNNIKRTSTHIRASSSLNEINALKGIGADFRVNKNISLMVFASARPTDANVLAIDTLENDPEILISSIQTTGLHRTVNEIQDKHQVTQTTLGGSVRYNYRTLSIGLNTVFDKFDKRLEPQDRIYNRYYFRGNEALNSSIDYSWMWRNFIFFGETGMNRERSIATVNGLLLGLSPKVSMSILHRYLPPKYYALHGRVFSDQTNPTNESGLYTGLEVRVSPRLLINAYADYFKHPWLTFNASLPSYGSDYLARISYIKRKKWESYFQVRNVREDMDRALEGKTKALGVNNKTNVRIHFSKKIGNYLDWDSRLELLFLNTPDGVKERGSLVFQELWFKPLGKSYSGFTRFTLFNTDSYQSRIYAFEHYQAFDSSVLPFYGTGTRLNLGIRYKTYLGITLELAYNLTHYTNQTTIGSGNDLIQGNIRSDFRFQLRYALAD